MADLSFHDGFENGFTAWDGVFGSPTVQGTIKHTGNYAMRCNTSSAVAGAIQGAGSKASGRINFNLYIASLPDSECIILGNATASLTHRCANSFVRLLSSSPFILISTVPIG